MANMLGHLIGCHARCFRGRQWLPQLRRYVLRSIVHFIYLKRSFSITLQYLIALVISTVNLDFAKSYETLSGWLSVSETKSGLSKPSRFANYSKHSSQPIFFASLSPLCFYWPQNIPPQQWQPLSSTETTCVTADYVTYNVSHLSRDILILSRDKKNVACPLWATVEDIIKITRQNQRNNSKQITRHKTNYHVPRSWQDEKNSFSSFISLPSSKLDMFNK